MNGIKISVRQIALTGILTGGLLMFTNCISTDGKFSENNGTWVDASLPSLYETYSEHFDYVGLAAEYGNFGLKQNGSNKYTASYTADGYWGRPNELYYSDVLKGISKHANTITLGNELKPQFVLGWWAPGTGDENDFKTVKFTGTNGVTIDVPASFGNEKLIYATLNAAKSAGVKMRGHVLTWHSQTPDDFFAENYSAKSDNNFSTLSNPVSKEVMTARHEWYIKSLLECVAAWEKENGYGMGNHLIWAWDVVNEAVADDGNPDGNFYRGSTSGTRNKGPANGGSRWYEIYNSNEFIINAFRFANKYAPQDVELCYNDYNEYQAGKTEGIIKLLQAVQNAEIVNPSAHGVEALPARIDVMAMQSHVGVSYPGVASYKSALEKFMALGLNIHVSELDFSAASQEEAAAAYGEYFSMFQDYGNKSGRPQKIECVTIWGINNQNSWINPAVNYSKKDAAGNFEKYQSYPLLFDLIDNNPATIVNVPVTGGSILLPKWDEGDSYKPNASFNAVIRALKS